MKSTLTAIALGAILASSPGAFAGPTSTTTQTGIGNTAYTEQSLVDPAAPASATIIQVGNNNRAGDPVAQTPGIFQRHITAYSRAVAKIHQVGNENTASIVQDGTSFPVNAKIKGSNYSLITQAGNSNQASVTQSQLGVGQADRAYINQVGNGFVASIAQNGSGNEAGVYQH